jgi:hypothetical protein
MKKLIMLLVLASCAFALPALADDVPLIDISRLSVGFGVEKAWAFESFDVGNQVGNEWYAKIPFAYTLPLSIPSAITGRAEKSLTSRTVGFRLGVQVVLFRNGAWIGGQ